MLQQELNVAVFIDCENVNPQITIYAQQITSQFGRITIKRGYGNIQTLASKWQDILLKEAFTPCLHYQQNGGKNGADLALALDALEIFFDRKADVFCLVTSDFDFSHLCRKLRERGAKVYIIGEQTSSDALRNCSDMFFTFVPRLLPQPSLPKEPLKVALNPTPQPPKVNPPNKPNLFLADVFDFTVDFVQQKLTAIGTNELNLALVAKEIMILKPNLKPTYYGYSTWSGMLQNCSKLQLKIKNGACYVSLKNLPDKQ